MDVSVASTAVAHGQITTALEIRLIVTSIMAQETKILGSEVLTTASGTLLMASEQTAAALATILIMETYEVTSQITPVESGLKTIQAMVG